MADLGLGAVFGAINTTFKFSEFVIKLSEVRPENLVFVRTIQKVRVDLEETERLLSNPSIKAVLNNNPQKLMWMKNSIDSTRHALNDIGRYVERVRSESDRDGTIDFATRVRWVLQDHAKLENRRSELAACQQTLTAVLISLNQIEMFMGISAVSGPGNDVPPPSYEASVFDADFRGPNSRRKRRIKVTQDDVKAPEDAKNDEHQIARTANGEILCKDESWNTSWDAKSNDTINPQLAYKTEILEDHSRPTLSRSVIAPASEQRCSQTSINPIPYHKSQEFFELPLDESVRPRSSISMVSPTLSFSTDQQLCCGGTNDFGPINPWDNWNVTASIDPNFTLTSASSSNTMSARSSSINTPSQVYSQRPWETTIPPPGRTRSETIAEMETLSISAEYPTKASLSARQHSVPQISISAELPGETPMCVPTTPQYTAYMPQHTQHRPPAVPLYEKVENSHPHRTSASNAIELRNFGQSTGHIGGQPIQMPYPSQSHNSLHTASHNVYIDEGPVEMPQLSQYTAPPLAPYPTTPPPPLSHVSSEPTIPHRSGRQHPTQLLPGEIGTRTMSQSRRRKAKMEAALGVRY